MNRELSIKIKIADREYPMKVAAEDEERIRLASRVINERLKSYRERFGIDDKQDLLSMVAFDCMVDKLQAEEKYSNTDETVIEKISYINSLITQSL